MEIKVKEDIKEEEFTTANAAPNNNNCNAKRRQNSLKDTVFNFFKNFSEKKHDDQQKYIRLTESNSEVNKSNKFVKQITKNYSKSSVDFVKKSNLKKFNTDPSLSENKKANFSDNCEVFVFDQDQDERMVNRHKESVNFDLPDSDEEVACISENTDDISLNKENYEIKSAPVNNFRICKPICSLETISERGKHSVFESVTRESKGVIASKFLTDNKESHKSNTNSKTKSSKVDGRKRKSENNDSNIFNYVYAC